MKLKIGVDIGGTFTDCVIFNEKGVIRTFKNYPRHKISR